MQCNRRRRRYRRSWQQKKWISDSSVTQCFAQLCAPPTTTLTLGLAPCVEVWMDGCCSRVGESCDLVEPSSSHVISTSLLAPLCSTKIQIEVCQKGFRDKNCYSYTNLDGRADASDGLPFAAFVRPSVFALEMHFHITHVRGTIEQGTTGGDARRTG